MKDYKALVDALHRRITENRTNVSIGATLAREIAQALEEAGKVLPECVEARADFDPKTHADRIRAMSNKGIAKLFVDAVSGGCPPEMDWNCCKDEYGWDGCEGCWENWLQQPAEGGGSDGTAD